MFFFSYLGASNLVHGVLFVFCARVAVQVQPRSGNLAVRLLRFACALKVDRRSGGEDFSLGEEAFKVESAVLNGDVRAHSGPRASQCAKRKVAAFGFKSWTVRHRLVD